MTLIVFLVLFFPLGLNRRCGIYSERTEKRLAGGHTDKASRKKTMTTEVAVFFDEPV